MTQEISKGFPSDGMREIMARGVSAQQAYFNDPLFFPEGTNLTRIVMASDAAHRDGIDIAIAEGEVERSSAVWLIGSYFRFEWAMENLSFKEIKPIFLGLWRGSDPRESEEAWELWTKMYADNGAMLFDETPLPLKTYYTIYRGQVGDTIGFCWTLDFTIAAGFAKTGGGRGTVSGGKVLTGRCYREDVLGYLTGRDESEIIISPAKVKSIKEVKNAV